jgi:hypothetical protein
MKQKLVLVTFLLCSIFNGFAQTVKQDSLTQAAVETTKSVSEVLKSADGTADALQKVQVDSAKNWKFNGMVSLNTSATFLTNWAAGGNNVATMVAAGNIRIIYQKNKFAWETFFDTDFGYSYMDIQYNKWRKSNDKINFTTKAGYSITKKLYVTALGSFRSQYADGYDYFDDHDSTSLISKWLSPSYTDLSVGLDWKPSKIFSLYYSPAAARLTTVLDPNLRVKYGINPNKSFKFEGGMTAKASLNYQYKTLKVISTLTLFTPYVKDKFGNVDVDWDVSLSYQFLKVLNVTFGTTMKYYDAILIPDKEGNNPTQRVQFKTTLGVGLGSTF